jgi:hypothetical protein
MFEIESLEREEEPAGMSDILSELVDGHPSFPSHHLSE